MLARIKSDHDSESGLLEAACNAIADHSAPGNGSGVGLFATAKHYVDGVHGPPSHLQVEYDQILPGQSTS